MIYPTDSLHILVNQLVRKLRAVADPEAWHGGTNSSSWLDPMDLGIPMDTPKEETCAQSMDNPS